MKTEKPSLMEIVKETGMEMGLPKLARGISCGAGHIFDSLSFWYILPTMKRRLWDEKGESDDVRESNYNIMEGIVKGAMLDPLALVPVLNLGLHEDWKYYMIPVATNLVSWTYEGYKKARKKK